MVLSELVSFTSCDVSEAHPCDSTCLYLITFLWLGSTHPILFIQSSVDDRSSCFHVLAVTNCAALNPLGIKSVSFCEREARNASSLSFLVGMSFYVSLLLGSESSVLSLACFPPASGSPSSDCHATATCWMRQPHSPCTSQSSFLQVKTTLYALSGDTCAFY